MPRPIWKGSISFGLVNIPVTLYAAEKASEGLHFHLLDSRNRGRIRYEKINELTGKSVPWNKVVKAYEFEKGNYVIVDEQQLEKVAAKSNQLVEIEAFVKQSDLEPLYFLKPYYLVPTPQGVKGYVLLRETLEHSQKAGIVKVVIRTRQYLAALLPYKNILVLNLLRFAKEVEDPTVLEIPQGTIKSYNLSNKEIEMAEQLIDTMTIPWDPKKYHDKNRELLEDWLKKRVKHGKAVRTTPTKEKPLPRAEVIDFMTLLKKSIHDKEKGPKKRKTK